MTTHDRTRQNTDFCALGQALSLLNEYYILISEGTGPNITIRILNMYRALMFCCCLLFAHFAHATIYYWVDHQGNTHYGQRPPQDKSLVAKKVFIKSSGIFDAEKTLTPIQDSANAIAASNAERKAANDEALRQANDERRLQEHCDATQKSLEKLDYGGNRLYKDADGNYSRLSYEEKTKQRQKLEAFLQDNCY